MSKEAIKLALEALENLIKKTSGQAIYSFMETERRIAMAACVGLREALAEPDYRAMYLKVRDELAALQQSRAPLTSKEIRAIEVDVATNLSLDYPSPAEQFTRAIEARHGIK